MATSWKTTRFALAKLEELLHCPICHQLMTEPHMITTCDHCFCRDCVVTTLCHRGNSCCPLCELPSWIKDVRPNYQLMNIINYVRSINVILSTTNHQETPVTNIKSSDQIIERRIRSRLRCDLNLHITPAAVVTINHRWATDSQRNKTCDSLTVTVSGGKRKIEAEDKTQPTSLVKRLKTVEEEFPFSPMVSKMRSFSKLDSTSKIQRLKHSQALVPHQKLSSSLRQSKLERFLSISKQPYRSESIIPVTPSMSLCHTMRKNKRGETPLHIAAIKGDIVHIRMLLQHGANPNVKDNAGWTPLHEACNHGHHSVVQELLNNGAIVNIPGYHNNTPLHDAVENGSVDIVKLLINNGAKNKMRNHQGHTPIDMAATDVMKSVLLDSVPQQSSIIKKSHEKLPQNVVSSQRDIVVLATGLNKHQKSFLKSTVSILGGRVVEEFSSDVSHIVTVCDENKCCSRTLKCLYAVVNGKWLLSYQWVLCSNESQEWIDEENYEIKGFVVNGENWVTEAPHKGRDNKAPGLFDGCEFYFTGTFHYPMPNKADLIQLVLQSGGKVLSREPKEDDTIFSSCYPFHAPPDSVFSSCHIVIIYQSCEHHLTGNIAHLPASWILDSISCFRLTEFTV